MRRALGPGRMLRAGEMVWMTDHTPHESLPLPPGSFRQYFRLVTSEIGVWFADHSTPNPTGTVPPPGVEIIKGNKFQSSSQASTSSSSSGGGGGGGDSAEAPPSNFGAGGKSRSLKDKVIALFRT